MMARRSCVRAVAGGGCEFDGRMPSEAGGGGRSGGFTGENREQTKKTSSTV
jgi:hypothetical protein